MHGYNQGAQWVGYSVLTSPKTRTGIMLTAIIPSQKIVITMRRSKIFQRVIAKIEIWLVMCGTVERGKDARNAQSPCGIALVQNVTEFERENEAQKSIMMQEAKILGTNQQMKMHPRPENNDRPSNEAAVISTACTMARA